MDFQSAMETFAEAWVAANTKSSDITCNGPQVSESAVWTKRDESLRCIVVLFPTDDNSQCVGIKNKCYIAIIPELNSYIYGR